MNRLFILLLVSSLSHAVVYGQGVHGGGEGIVVNGELHLMDLVKNLEESSRCEWVPLNQRVENHPIHPIFVKNLSNLHAYLVQAFQNESSRITVCFAGDLKSLVQPEYRRIVFDRFLIEQGHLVQLEESRVVQDPGHPVFQRINAKRQTIAFRYGHKVIVDTKLFESLDSIGQYFLFVHEIGQGFIPMDVNSWTRPEVKTNEITYVGFQPDENRIFERPSRLWSFIQTLYSRVVAPGTVDAESLRRSLNLNQVALPLSDEFWKETEDAYRTLFGRSVPDETKSRALQQIPLETAKKSLFAADWDFLAALYKQFYAPARKVIQERYLGWENALKDLIPERELDPTLRLPGGQNLLEEAFTLQDARLNEMLLRYTLDRPNLAGIQSLGHALIEARVPKSMELEVLNRIDPNLRTERIGPSNPTTNALIHYGRPTFFFLALKEKRLPYAEAWLHSGRVSRATALEGIPQLVRESSTRDTIRIPDAQENTRRRIFDIIFLLSGNSAELLTSVIQEKDEYAFDRIIETANVRIGDIQLLLKSAWKSDPALLVIRKALDRYSGSLDQSDDAGLTLLDRALGSLDARLYQFLASKGAKSIRNNWNIESKYWALTQLIELNDEVLVREFRKSHTELKGLWIIQAIDYAKLRGKLNVLTVLQPAE